MVTCPLEVVKTRLQSSNAFHYPSSTQTSKLAELPGLQNPTSDALRRPDEQRRRFSSAQKMLRVRHSQVMNSHFYLYDIMSTVYLGDGQHRATLLVMINLDLSLNPTQAAVGELLECKMIAPVYHFLSEWHPAIGWRAIKITFLTFRRPKACRMWYVDSIYVVVGEKKRKKLSVKEIAASQKNCVYPDLSSILARRGASRPHQIAIAIIMIFESQDFGAWSRMIFSPLVS